jgi:2,3-bisphosphoglycerate-dependent phosphoglycerate mutase
MQHVVLLRHGESELNAVNRSKRVYCGQFETPLNARGREQALAAAQRLCELDYLRLSAGISSPLERAKQTLSIVLSQMPGPIRLLEPSPGLLERSHGAFEGRSEDDVFLEHPAYRDDPELACFMDHFHLHAPGGESLSIVSQRAWPVVESLLGEQEGDLLVVSHYNPIRCIVGSALGMSEAEILRLRIPNAVPIVLRYNGSYELTNWPAFAD